MKKALLILSLFTFFSCNSDDDADISNFQPSEIEYTEIAQGALSGNGEEGINQSNMVIINNSEWQDLITQMNTINNETDSFAETNINFNRYKVIAVFEKIKPTGWEIEIENITENQTNITVTTQETELDNMVICQPYHIVKIPKNNKEVVFE